MIEVQNLHKAFKKVNAVQGVSFQAHDGQITGLLGPNGAGKTTTLRVLYGVFKPDRGRVEVDGYDVTAQPQAVQRRIGALPDSRGLYPRLSARENIRYFGQLHGLAGEELASAVQDLVKLLDMQEFIDRPCEGFSQGQRLKVAIARALVHQPQNILLDEPTNGLDVMSTRALRTLILRFRDEGKCVLFSSHVMQEVAALCDTIVVMAQGRVVAAGTPQELRETTGQDNLEDAFVAAIGSEEGLVL
ncbi:ATP-binding cassette domain-containing protein [Candidatus Cyanaurora vandensis]|uniref:ABC transporter ATP-binding protein n=1 Tax=Candidatus Cyanaurora vandensis TaxID=2714958 RepID=UPI002580D944|nr:ATP-binding cassette domain-containing protein [Candidatus Cyanaurora vandensis]